MNGQPALVFVEDARVEAALILDISERRIVAVRTVSNPDKLARLNRELAQAGGYEPAATRGRPTVEPVPTDPLQP